MSEATTPPNEVANEVAPPGKAHSVNEDGTPDGYTPPSAYTDRVLPGGMTRIEVSSPAEKLHFVHKALVESIQYPCKVRYLKLTDRQRGQLEKPESYVAVDVSKARMLQALEDYHDLFYEDARHQLWILGAQQEQIVLDELGMIFVYPDDFLFREVLAQMGWSTEKHEGMDTRDYVKVHFRRVADEQEQTFFQRFGLTRWEG